MSRIAPMSPPAQKQKALVSKAIRDAARGQKCSLRLDCCTGDEETTVFAHLRVFGAAGMGQKPIDLHGVFACNACHDAIDGRNGPKPPGYGHLLRALMETQRALLSAGLIQVAPNRNTSHKGTKR